MEVLLTTIRGAFDHHIHIHTTSTRVPVCDFSSLSHTLTRVYHSDLHRDQDIKHQYRHHWCAVPHVRQFNPRIGFSRSLNALTETSGMRGLLLLSLLGVRAISPRLPLWPGQDGHEKTLAPWISHQHLPSDDNTTRIKLISQCEISEKRMERANAIPAQPGKHHRGVEKQNVAGEEEGAVRRALKWVLQIEYSGQSFFDG